MSLPVDIERAFNELHRQVRNREKALSRSINKLQTLVLGHYQDVHTLIRHQERRLNRIDEKLGFSPLPPESMPRALPNPP